METKMKHIKHVVPHKIMEYLDEHYEDAHLLDIKEEKINKATRYKIDIEDDENLHHLEFSDKGSLIKDATETMFEKGRHEDFIREEGLYES